MSESTCKAILSPVLQAGLPASGFVSTFPRTVIHGPLAYQGLNILDLFLVQGISHILYSLEHGHNALSLESSLLCTSVQQFSLKLGFPRDPFTQNLEIAGAYIMADCWIKHMITFINHFAIKLQMDVPQLHLQWELDKFLMPTFIASGVRQPLVLQALQRCRLYLRATTLADIMDGNREVISTWAWFGQQDKLRQTSLQWPTQPRPPESDWNLWQTHTPEHDVWN